MARKSMRAAHASVKFLTPKDVSVRWEGRVAVGTLRNWRWLKRGPPFVRLGRRVMYQVSDVIAWEKLNTVHDERA
jgi:hypothetical protein